MAAQTMSVRFRIVIEGEIQREFIEHLVMGAKDLAPVDGALTIQFGKAVDARERKR